MQKNINITDYTRPSVFMRVTKNLPNIFDTISISMILSLLWIACIYIPTDHQQGENYKILYIHVPMAWMSLLFYIVVAILSLLYLIYKHPFLHISAKSFAYVGTYMTALTLVTGSLWGLPVWGTYWVWDARLTSMLVLLFFYLAYMIVCSALSFGDNSSRMSSVLALIGAINIPIVKFSVEWWNTLHQSSTISQTSSSMDSSMSYILSLIFVAFMLFNLNRVIVLVRKEIVERKVQTFYQQK